MGSQRVGGSTVLPRGAPATSPSRAVSPGPQLPASVLPPQVESSLREKAQQLESVQDARSALEEQLRRETAAKVTLPLTAEGRSC